MATIATLNISVTANAAQAQKALKDTGSAVQYLSNLIAGLGLYMLVKDMASVAVASERWFEETVHGIAAMGRLADKIGTSTEELQRLQYAAMMVGVTTEDLNLSLDRMNVHIGKAIEGEKEAVATFYKLHINLQELVRMDPSDQFKRIATALKELKTPAEQAALAQEVFSKSSKNVLALLQQGGSVIGNYGREADALGSILSSIEVDKVIEADKQLQKFWATMKGLTGHLLADLAPAIESVIKSFEGWVTRSGGVGRIVSENVYFITQQVAELADNMELVKGLFYVWRSVCDVVAGAMTKVLLELFKTAGLVVQALLLPIRLVEGITGVSQIAYDYSQRIDQTAANIQAHLDGINNQYKDNAKAAEDAFSAFDDQKHAKSITAFWHDVTKGANEAAGAIDEAAKAKRELAKQRVLEEDWSDLKKYAETVFKDVELPIEKFYMGINKLEEAFANGFVNTETFLRMLEKYKKDFEKETDPKALKKQKTSFFKEIDLNLLNVGALAKASREQQEVHDPQLQKVIQAINNLKKDYSLGGVEPAGTYD